MIFDFQWNNTPRIQSSDCSLFDFDSPSCSFYKFCTNIVVKPHNAAVPRLFITKLYWSTRRDDLVSACSHTMLLSVTSRWFLPCPPPALQPPASPASQSVTTERPERSVSSLFCFIITFYKQISFILVGLTCMSVG